MKRRALITLLGGAMAWPLAARAQQPRSPTVGYLGATTAAAERSRTDAFVRRLSELGWIEGHTVAIEPLKVARQRARGSSAVKGLKMTIVSVM